MDDATLMDVTECQTELNEPIQYLILREWFPLLLLDECREVTTLTVADDDRL